MAKEWQELTRMTGASPFVIERVRMADGDTAIEGSFELPPLARLPMEDQVFVMAFVRSHGSIKEMERIFGVSYPTVKNRLNRIAEGFELVEVDATNLNSEALAQLERGEITFEEAIGRISG